MTGNPIPRRHFLSHLGALATSGGLWAGCQTPLTARRQENCGLRLISKEIFIPTQDGSGVFPGFITYIHQRKNILLHRFGWVDASDTYDNFHDSISRDNGKTWSEPVLKLKSHTVEGGRIRYCENTGFLDTDTGKLITAVSKFFYPNDSFNQDVPRQLEVNVYDPFGEEKPEPFDIDFDLPGGIGISFCFPIKTSAGRIVIPAMKAQVGVDGDFLHHPQSGSVIYEVRMVMGEYQSDGSIFWHVGQPLTADPQRSSRGFSESSPVELQDGRLALLCRGSNAGMSEVPGYKWLSFSHDGGETWSQAEPLCGDDGQPIESSATGCACFRSIADQKLYFIGNLCTRDRHADGNWPRNPLVIAELQEEPFAIKRETVTVIDDVDFLDSPRTQISNFRYYQDRRTGDVVVFVTRFGENEVQKWKWANYYRYRVAIG